MNKEVSINDFIMPEFKGANPEEYERRADGQIVRKDRWVNAMRKIVTLVGLNDCSFEINDIVDRVRQLVSHELASWKKINYEDQSTLPLEGSLCLVDWDCLDYDIALPQVLIWERIEGISQWIDQESGQCGLDIPSPTHFKYVGKRPERIANDN